MTKDLTHYIYLFLLLFIFNSCQTYDLVTLEQLRPAELYFPGEIQKVAVVNTMIPLEKNLEKVTLSETFRGDGKAAIESLAENLVAENYFEQIVICDSVIQEEDTYQQQSIYLSNEKVRQLCEDLDSEMLITLEDLKLTPKKLDRFFNPFIAQHCYSIDMEVSPLIRMYLPEKALPLYTISPKDTIFWESCGGTEREAQRKLIKLDTAIQEASEYAGVFTVKYITPYWETTERFFYMNGSPEMRDAFIYARRYEWDEAIKRWHTSYEHIKKKKKKMRAAYNLAVGYELKGEVEESEKWFETALSYLKDEESEKIMTGDEKNMSYTEDTVLLYFFYEQLKKRKGELTRLNIQMKRFEKEK